MKISIIIPVYNEEKLISKTLESISTAKKKFETNPNNKLEIVVVDNNSTDKSVEICRKFDVVIVEEKVHNIARVRNTGAKYATGDVLCFLDADSEVGSNIFLLIKERMLSNKYIGGGTVFKLDKNNLIFKGVYLATVLFTHILRLSGVLIYVRKADFIKMGGFNEEYFAAEDIDFVIRMKRYGKTSERKYSNIYRSYVITSSRKFKLIKPKDLFYQGGLLLHKSLRKDQNKCEQWYNVSEYR